MAAIHIAQRVVAKRGTVATAAIEIDGVTAEATSSIVTEDHRCDLAWLSLTLERRGDSLIGHVLVDPSQGDPARPGVYTAAVWVVDGGIAVLQPFEVEVERHECARLSPRASFDYNLVSRTATMDVEVWNCGNVDLSIDLEAEWCGSAVRVSPPSLSVGVGEVRAFELTVGAPADGPVCDGDIDIRPDVGNACPVPPTPPPIPPWWRSGGAVAGLMVVVAILVTLAQAFANDDPADVDPITTSRSTAGEPTTVATSAQAPATTVDPGDDDGTDLGGSDAAGGDVSTGDGEFDAGDDSGSDDVGSDDGPGSPDSTDSDGSTGSDGDTDRPEPPPPAIEILDRPATFSAPVGSIAADQTVVVSNGGGFASIEAVLDDGVWFAVDPPSCDLATGDTCELRIAFFGEGIGDYADVVRLMAAGSELAAVDLLGVVTPAGPDLGFDSVTLDPSARATNVELRAGLTIANSGDDASGLRLVTFEVLVEDIYQLVALWEIPGLAPEETWTISDIVAVDWDAFEDRVATVRVTIDACSDAGSDCYDQSTDDNTIVTLIDQPTLLR